MYTSFLFNLLSQSLQLKTYSTNIETYYNQGNIYNFAETVAKIIRIIFDFESSEASSYGNQFATVKAAKLLRQHSPSEVNKNGIVNLLAKGLFKAVAPTMKLKPVQLKGFMDYEGLTNEAPIVESDTWTWDDFVQFGLGTIDGAMGALPSGTSGLYCNRNSTLARQHLIDTMKYFEKNDVKNGMKYFNNFATLTDEISNNCYYFFAPYLTLDYSTFLNGNTLLENVLYNAGFMFTDIITVATTDPLTVSNWSYVLASTIGDFLIRFFYRDTSL